MKKDTLTSCQAEADRFARAIVYQLQEMGRGSKHFNEEYLATAWDAMRAVARLAIHRKESLRIVIDLGESVGDVGHPDVRMMESRFSNRKEGQSK